MLRLTARYADAWNAWGRNSAGEIPADRANVDAACTAVGRDSATLERTVAVLVDLPGKAGRPRETKPALSGTPEELAAAFRDYAREGIGHVQIVLDPNTLAGLEALAPVIALLDE
jgi:alkanesulfonate monooxygenase SsuD/methylene tetrahydromethanopterin reductase-like flavin-dependent oxidoreductase (luciferase family)